MKMIFVPSILNADLALVIALIIVKLIAQPTM
jgi:hypothetical protein